MTRAFLLGMLLAMTSLTSGLESQCLNEVSEYNMRDRTMATNNTWFMVPVKKTAVEAALREAFPKIFDLLGLRALELLDLPAYLDFPAGFHPVIALAGKDDDIRQLNLKIDGSYMGASTLIPWVGKGGSLTPLIAPLTTQLAGTDDEGKKYIATLIPNAVATVGGQETRTGNFIPSNAAWQSNSDDLGSFGINAQFAALPNPLSGPGLYPEVVDLKFVSLEDQSSPRHNISIWKQILNQPYLLKSLSGKCLRNVNYFNNSTSTPTYRTGNVTFGPAAGVNLLTKVLQKAGKDGVGIFEFVDGFSACAQVVGYGGIIPAGEDCDEAAALIQRTQGAL